MFCSQRTQKVTPDKTFQINLIMPSRFRENNLKFGKSVGLASKRNVLFHGYLKGTGYARKPPETRPENRDEKPISDHRYDQTNKDRPILLNTALTIGLQLSRAIFSQNVDLMLWK